MRPIIVWLGRLHRSWKSNVVADLGLLRRTNRPSCVLSTSNSWGIRAGFPVTSNTILPFAPELPARRRRERRSLSGRWP